MEITIRPTWKQHLAYQALEDPEVDVVFLGGGAGGGKSWTICESRLVRALRYPGYKSFIGREELTRLMGSTYLTWVKVCAHHGIKQDKWHLNGQYHYIEFTNGSRIDLLDLKFLPSDPLYERLGSTEYTDGAIEEAGEVNFLAFDVLKSRVNRHLNKELGIKANTLITGNPKKNWTYTEFYKPWKENRLPKGTVFIQSLYKDNPYTAESYGTDLARIKDKTLRQRLKDGNWEYEQGDGQLMNYEAITDLFTNTIEESDEKYLTIDVARFGGDKIVVYLWEGLKSTKQWVYQKQSLEQTKIDIKQIAVDNKVPFSHIVADEDGVGGGIVDGLAGIKGFVNNSSPLEKKVRKDDEPKLNYKNLKSQCSFMLADLVNNHAIGVEISLETKVDEVTEFTFKESLIEELEQIKQKDSDDDEKKLQVVSKEEVKDALGRSPDYADTLMMRLFFELTHSRVGQPAKQFVPQNIDRNPGYQIHKPEVKLAKQYIPHGNSRL